METLYPLLSAIKDCKEASIHGHLVPIESLLRMEAQLLRVHQLARRNTAIASAAMEITSGGGSGGPLITLASVCHQDAGEAARLMAGPGPTGIIAPDDWALLSRLARDPCHEIRVTAHLAAEELGH